VIILGTRRILSCAYVACAFAVACDANGQASGASTYPDRAIRLVVGSAPGGGIDFIGRMLAQRMTAVTGQPVVVDNKPGASTTIGAAVVAKAPPDGYTIYMASTSFTGAGSLYSGLPYDTLKDFVPVTLVASGSLVVAVNPSVPAKTVPELIAWAKSRSEKVTFGSSGTGTSVHLAGELFRARTGIEYVHVPYKGGAPATADLIAGRIDMVIASVAEILGQLKAGKARAIAVLGQQRSSSLPDVPTMAEGGFPLDVSLWYGVLAPAGTPIEVVNRLHEIIARALADPEVRVRIAAQSVEVITAGPEKFGPYMQADFQRWARVIKEGNIRAD